MKPSPTTSFTGPADDPLVGDGPATIDGDDAPPVDEAAPVHPASSRPTTSRATMERRRDDTRTSRLG